MDIEFKRITDKYLVEMLDYFRGSRLHISDFSCAHKFMWQKHYTLVFAYVCGCVVFAEKYMGRVYFHYPLSIGGDLESELAALDAVEEFCRKKGERLHFTNVPKERLSVFIERYGSELKLTNSRRWRDYLYNAQDFISYSGKKFSGQRNHVNKFKKLYPAFEFREIDENCRDIPAFLEKYSERQLAKGTVMAKEELDAVRALIPHIKDFGLLAGALYVGGKMIAMSIGEVCGDMLIVHVEKALYEYEGAYPTMAQEFARHFAAGVVEFINREDDAGDAGLRKSKLQYNPVGLVDKYNVYPHRLIDNIAHIPVLQGERVVIREICDADSLGLYRLEYDGERNKYWGYDWRQHFNGEPTPEYFLQSLRQDFKNREEVPFGIFLGNMFVGEVVLHNFGYRNDCEVGVRLLPEYEGFGYAREAVKCVCDYALYELNAEKVYAKCYRQNEKSRKTLISAGLKEVSADETYFRFIRTAEM